MNDDDAGFFGVSNVVERRGLTLEDDVAFVASIRVHSGQHLHQRGLASSVLAADGVHFTALDRQADILQRLDTREGLADIAHFQDVVSHLSPLSGAGRGRGASRISLRKRGGGFHRRPLVVYSPFSTSSLV